MITDSIQLNIPGRPEYISTVRLTASSIANMIGFDVESIEDIRVAISEACNMALCEEGIKITYTINMRSIEVRVESNTGLISYGCEESQKMGKQILSMLVDQVRFSEREIHFSKTVGDT